MAWMRLEIGYVDHPKFVALSDGAFRLWHAGKSYCEHHLTDGLILRAVGKQLHGSTEARRRELQTVVPPFTAPLWEVTLLGWQMHDYLDYNDGRDRQRARMAKVRHDLARKQQNQAEYRARHVTGHVTGHATDNGAASVAPALPQCAGVTDQSKANQISTHQIRRPQAPPDPPPPPAARSKRPIFSGQRLTVFEWMLDDCMKALGDLAAGFDLHAWFYALEARALAEGWVPPKRDSGAWLQAELLAECQRRGLPLRLASAAPDDSVAAITRSIRARLARDEAS